MKPLTWAQVVFSRDADAMRRSMDAVHRERLKNIITVIKNGPEDGLFAAQAADGTILRQMTGADTHVVYAVTFWQIGRVLLIVRIEIRDWIPLDH
ncbi:hypothetical protein [Candidatus Oscillochloris fontis]|uniref:hypothetical protein n=1 Tax=Candidatus Oscillochloris fontis TaxID=2496868 RepID=UPI00101C384E|nr:hypothetical protein [Candidatus Oscillochloris fontis]